MTDGLKEKHRNAIIDILAANERVKRVVLFGSRAMGTFSSTSDVDLALYGDALTLSDQAHLAAAMDDLPMAQRVDLLLYNSIDNKNLKEHIREHGKEWFRRGWDMSADWETATLGELINEGEASLQTGPFGTALKAVEYANSGVPLISVREIREGYLQLYLDTPRVSPSTTKRLPKFVLEEGDIVFGRKGGVDRNAIIESHQSGWFLGSDGIRLRLSPNYDSRFLSMQMRSPLIRAWLFQNCEGTTMPSLNQKVLARIPIILPPLKEQKIIAEILSDFDKKIELNRQINQTLEEMAQAIFKSWFVNFEPVKAKIEAKANGQTPERAAMCAIRGKTEAELDPLSPEQLAHLRTTAALFPDEFTDSELGFIPKGWEISTIGVEFKVTMGQSPPGRTYNQKKEGIPFFQGRRDFGWRYPANRVFCTAPKRFGQKGDTLLSVRAPVGDVNKATTGCCIGRGLAALRHKSGCEAYTYYTLKRLEQYFKNFDTEETVFGSINQKDLRAIKVICPELAILKEFSKVVMTTDEHILNNENQISTLNQLRDILLPKLLSGEISVNAAESFVREAI